MFVGPLFGMRAMTHIALDGYEQYYDPIKSGESSKEQSLLQNVKPFMQKILSQEVQKLQQNSAVSPSPASKKRAGKKLHRKNESDREKRMKVLDKFEGKEPSLPLHEAVLIVAGYLATHIDKRYDTKLFTLENSKKKVRKRGETVTTAAKKEQKIRHFDRVRLLKIFQFLIDNESFEPDLLWESQIQTLVQSGNFGIKGGKDSKFFSNTSLQTVLNLSQEIGCDIMSILEAQI